MLKLTMDSSLLGLVLGFLGSVIGIIMAFGSIEDKGALDFVFLASGLKVSLITTTFGLFTFIISRIGILVLRALQKSNKACIINVF
ncbi:MotA/TolQ/ExbB proton channel family protein [Flavivirga eckloniae]|nr:MotA/TolQ/ExbB proton channel family protein [Flavivirga eckloniae]